MAITKIWAIRKNVSSTLNYVANKEKTQSNDDELSRALTYLNHDTSTEEKCLVTGINCNPPTSFKEMISTKKRYGKMDGIQGFHAVQSFKPGEVTPSQAHQIAVELAQRLWGSRFEVVVATHLDKNHPHSHFVINSVSFADGKRYYDNKETYKKFRQQSDIICQQYGLNVIMPNGKGVNHFKYQLEPKRRDLIAKDVDYALSRSRTMKMFFNELAAMGYEVKAGKHIAVKPSWAQGFFRLYKLQGDKYSEENIIQAIEQNVSINWDTFSYATYPKEQAKKLKGFKALYFKYMYMLGILPKEKGNKSRVHFYLKEDLLYMDEITKQADFLEKKAIETNDDLQQFKEKASDRYKNLINERKSIYGRIKRCRNDLCKQLLKQDLATVTSELSQLRKDIKMVEQIEARSKKIEDNLNKVEQLENEINEDNKKKESKVI